MSALSSTVSPGLLPYLASGLSVVFPLAVGLLVGGGRRAQGSSQGLSTKQKLPEVLIVDDQLNWRDTLRLSLASEFAVKAVSSLAEARQAIFEDGEPFHVVVADIRLDDGDSLNTEGLDLVEEIQKKLDGFTSTIVITAYPSISSVKKALRSGAWEYVEKYPQDGTRFDLTGFQRAVQRAARAAARRRGEKVSPRALIIEDEPNWQQVLAAILQAESFEVEIVDTHREAKTRIRKRIFDLFVVDLRLKDISEDLGMQLLKDIEDFSTGAKAIIVTGFGTEQRLRAAFADHRDSVEDFFSKGGFDQGAFVNAARRAVADASTD